MWRRTGVLFLMLLFTIPCAANTITVKWDGSGDYPTIQAAIDATLDGDTVVVGDGVYTGDGNRDIEWSDKEITVKSENGATHCIIDCQGTEAEPHRGFKIRYVSRAAILEGFTITNGFGPPQRYGAPSLFLYTSVGGAILCDLSHPTIRNCVMRGNTVGGLKFPWGSAIGIFEWPSDPLIINCTIVKNAAAADAVHGAIGAWGYRAGAEVVNCIIWGNRTGTADSESAQIGYDTMNNDRFFTRYNCIQDLDLLAGNGNIDDDPCSSDYHLKSEAGRWDVDSSSWVSDDVTSPCVSAGDPCSEPSIWNCGPVNMGTYGGMEEASKPLVDMCYCAPDMAQWVAAGMPASWCYPRQCHGDADGSDEPYGNPALHLRTYVGNNDIAILATGYKKPYSGSPATNPWIAADFDHATEPYGPPALHLSARVANNDIAILVAYYKTDVPDDCIRPRP